MLPQLPAALINGDTHVHLMGIPTGKQLTKAPTSMAGTNIDAIKHTSKMLESLDMLIMDESIMTGRPYWAHIKHRCEECRTPVGEVVNDAFNTLQCMREVSLKMSTNIHLGGSIQFILSVM